MDQCVQIKQWVMFYVARYSDGKALAFLALGGSFGLSLGQLGLELDHVSLDRLKRSIDMRDGLIIAKTSLQACYELRRH